MDEALALLHLTCRLDLDDLTGATGGGLHLAAMGTVWQAIVFGFAGVRPDADMLTIDPHLPASWTQLDLRLRFRGARLRLGLRAAAIEVDIETEAAAEAEGAPLSISVGGGPATIVPREGARFVRREARWSAAP